MAISIGQTPVQIYLSIVDGNGAVLHNERYDFPLVSELPVLPGIGEPWNLVVEETNYGGTTVTDKTVTSYVAGDAVTTQIHITAVQ